MRKLPTLAAAAVVAAAASAVPVTGVFGSSHREAPQIMLDPSADNTDLYAFTAPDAPDKLTIVANWIPLEDPAGGPNFGKLDPEAKYYVKIDNTGDGVEDVGYRWKFKYAVPQPGVVPGVRAAGPLDRRPEHQLRADLRPVQGPLPQRPVGVEPDHRRRPAGRARQHRAEDVPGLRRRVANGAIKSVQGGGKSFVGPVDDPFFVDLGSIFDGVNIDQPGRPGIGLGNQGGGKDDVAGYNTHSFVLQVPKPDVTRDGRPSPARRPATRSSASGRRPSAVACRYRSAEPR